MHNSSTHILGTDGFDGIVSDMSDKLLVLGYSWCEFYYCTCWIFATVNRRIITHVVNIALWYINSHARLHWLPVNTLHFHHSGFGQFYWTASLHFTSNFLQGYCRGDTDVQVPYTMKQIPYQFPVSWHFLEESVAHAIQPMCVSPIILQLKIYAWYSNCTVLLKRLYLYKCMFKSLGKVEIISYHRNSYAVRYYNLAKMYWLSYFILTFFDKCNPIQDKLHLKYYTARYLTVTWKQRNMCKASF